MDMRGIIKSIDYKHGNGPIRRIGDILFSLVYVSDMLNVYRANGPEEWIKVFSVSSPMLGYRITSDDIPNSENLSLLILKEKSACHVTITPFPLAGREGVIVEETQVDRIGYMKAEIVRTSEDGRFVMIYTNDENEKMMSTNSATGEVISLIKIR